MKYRKKPIVVEAFQLQDPMMETMPEWFTDHVGRSVRLATPMLVIINTIEGDMKALPGDWIIKGIQGELYPCKPDIFEASYEPVGEANA